LAKEAPTLTKVRVGLGWEANAFDTGGRFDLDCSVFLLGANGKLVSDNHFVFYNNKTSPCNAVVHSGDNRTGDAVGDDESVRIDLTTIEPTIEEVSFIVTIHDDTGKLNFGQVKNSYIKLYDDSTGVEIAKYSLEDDFSTETAVQFGSLYKKDGTWMFKAVGAGYKKGLADFVVIYGGTLA
jgi:tellurium resistance protein TerD